MPLPKRSFIGAWSLVGVFSLGICFGCGGMVDAVIFVALCNIIDLKGPGGVGEFLIRVGILLSDPVQ